MTPEEYWDGENDLPRQFRKADQLRQERVSFNAWLQGYYIYESLLAVAPVFKFGIKNPKPAPYFEEPIPATEIAVEKQKQKQERKKMEENKSRMKEIARQINDRLSGGLDDA